MIKKVGLFVICLLLTQSAFADAGKCLIILQAGKESHEGMARAVHDLFYSKELKEHGHKAALVFDGPEPCGGKNGQIPNRTTC